MRRGRRTLLWTLFGLYCALMLWLLLLRRLGRTPPGEYAALLHAYCNLVPLRTIRAYLRLLRHSRPVLRHVAAVNLAGNVAMFLPLGVLPPLLWPRLRRLWRLLLWTGGAIAAMEVLQLVTLLGSCDVDDLLLNLLGVLLGWCLLRLFSHSKNTPDTGP